jgi:hypothetical protein
MATSGLVEAANEVSGSRRRTHSLRQIRSPDFLSILAETNKRTILAARQAHLLLLANNSGDSDEPPAASSISECHLPDYDELKVVTLLSIIR